MYGLVCRRCSWDRRFAGAATSAKLILLAESSGVPRRCAGSRGCGLSLAVHSWGESYGCGCGCGRPCCRDGRSESPGLAAAVEAGS